MAIKITEGQDANGNYAVQLRLRSDDPLLPIILELAEAAAHHKTDATGFTERTEADPIKAYELERLLLDVLKAQHPEVLQRLQDEAMKNNKSVSESLGQLVAGLPLSGLMNLLAGKPFAERRLADAIPNSGLREAICDQLRGQHPNFGVSLGDSRMSEHVKEQILSGQLDTLKPARKEQINDG